MDSIGSIVTALGDIALAAGAVLAAKKAIESRKPVAAAPAAAAPSEQPKTIVRRRAVLPPMSDDAAELVQRTRLFFGPEGMEKLRNSLVCVVGLGGVGSHAAIMLLRSGIEHLRLIDFDIIAKSNLNRHAVARRCDIGKSKALVLGEYCKDVCPQSIIEPIHEMINEETIDRLLCDKPDYVLDCIDNLHTKAWLLKYCQDKGIKVISSGGAGGCHDPTRIRISDISDSIGPLTRSVRIELKKLGGKAEGIPVVFTTETQVAPLLELPAHIKASGNIEAFREREGFRMRIMPVLGTSPAIFGNAIAVKVLSDLTGKPMECEPWLNKRMERYGKLLEQVVKREKKFSQSRGLVSNIAEVFGIDHAEYAADFIFHGKSVKSNSIHNLVLTRWDSDKSFSLRNCVLLTKTEAQLHDNCETMADVKALYGDDLFARVEKRLATVEVPNYLDMEVSI